MLGAEGGGDSCQCGGNGRVVLCTQRCCVVLPRAVQLPVLLCGTRAEAGETCLSCSRAWPRRNSALLLRGSTRSTCVAWARQGSASQYLRSVLDRRRESAEPERTQAAVQQARRCDGRNIL